MYSWIRGNHVEQGDPSINEVLVGSVKTIRMLISSLKSIESLHPMLQKISIDSIEMDENALLLFKNKTDFLLLNDSDFHNSVGCSCKKTDYEDYLLSKLEQKLQIKNSLQEIKQRYFRNFGIVRNTLFINICEQIIFLNSQIVSLYKNAYFRFLYRIAENADKSNINLLINETISNLIKDGNLEIEKLLRLELFTRIFYQF